MKTALILGALMASGLSFAGSSLALVAVVESVVSSAQAQASAAVQFGASSVDHATSIPGDLASDAQGCFGGIGGQYVGSELPATWQSTNDLCRDAQAGAAHQIGLASDAVSGGLYGVDFAGGCAISGANAGDPSTTLAAEQQCAGSVIDGLVTG